jgi:hypothetical protein
MLISEWIFLHKYNDTGIQVTRILFDSGAFNNFFALVGNLVCNSVLFNYAGNTPVYRRLLQGGSPVNRAAQFD